MVLPVIQDGAGHVRFSTRLPPWAIALAHGC
jgi:hypothetical protein